jgi:hypothetical protein
VCDTLHSHPKIYRADLEAMGLWVLAGSWAAQQMTDGHIPLALVRQLGGTDAEQLAKRLVTAGFWEVTEDGYCFHEWEDYQRTRAEIEAQRKFDRDRKRRQRLGGSPTGTDAGTDAVIHRGSPTGSPTGTPPGSHGGFPEGKGRSLRTTSPFPESGVTPTGSPSGTRVSDLCDHGRDGKWCPYCVRKAGSS